MNPISSSQNDGQNRTVPIQGRPVRLSFAMLEISLILAKLHWMYDLELLDKSLDWEGKSHTHVMWWRPKLPVQLTLRCDMALSF